MRRASFSLDKCGTDFQEDKVGHSFRNRSSNSSCGCFAEAFTPYRRGLAMVGASEAWALVEGNREDLR